MKWKLSIVLLLGGLVVASTMAWGASPTGQEPAAAALDRSKTQFVGAAKCKNCHKTEERGKVYDHWLEGPHAKAFEVLGTDEAKATATKMGLGNPQEAAECLRCHATAQGVDEKLVNKRFDHKLGVQCESCHGPGGDHVKARLKAAAKGFGKGETGPLEIPLEMTLPAEADCRGCHNEESPNFKGFEFKEYLPKIRHMHSNRTEPRVVAEGEEAAKAADS